MEGYLLRRVEIEAMAGTAKTHFLEPGAKRLNKSLGDATGLTGIGFHLIEVQPGDDSTALHVHSNEDECVYVLSGRGTAYIGDEMFEISAGDFIGYRKGGAAHRLRNSGGTVLRCLVAGERNAHDVCDYPEAGQRLLRAPGLPGSVTPLAAIRELPAGVGKK
nr:cupin domain-containing protein [uncultured Acidocella sp.]